MAKIVLVSCSKRRIPFASQAKAKDVYTSPLFEYSMYYAKHKLKASKIFILSAKYYLLDPEKRIYSVDTTLNRMKVRRVKEWAWSVAYELKRRTRPSDELVLLTGARYSKYLIPLVSDYYKKPPSEPLKHMSFGLRLQYLKKMRN